MRHLRASSSEHHQDAGSSARRGHRYDTAGRALRQGRSGSSVGPTSRLTCTTSWAGGGPPARRVVLRAPHAARVPQKPPRRRPPGAPAVAGRASRGQSPDGCRCGYWRL